MTKKYKSKLERVNGNRLKSTEDIDWWYEPKEGRIKYVIPASIHTYTPDFPFVTRTGKFIVVETKGIWEYEDRKKHAFIKEQYPSLDIRFVFTNSRTKTSKGAKQSYADICEGRGRGIFKGKTWMYADRVIPEEWFDE